MSDEQVVPAQAEQRVYYRRVIRYVIGVTICCGLAFGIGWGLSFIVPVFLAKFLADYSAPSRELFIQLFMAMVLTVLIGAVIGLGAAHYPLILLLLVALLMFWAYYLFLDPKWNFFATILMIAGMLLPYLGITDVGLIIYVGQGLSLSGVLAVAAFFILHWLFPENEKATTKETSSAASMPLSKEQRVQDAFCALLIAYPVIVFFYYFQLNGAILTMVFIGILSLQTTGVKSIKISAFLLLTNGLGGLLAVLLYELLVTAPKFLFLVALVAFISLVIAAKIYQQPEKAPIWAGVMSAMLVVLGGTITSDSKLIEVSFYGRIGQIILASAYMVAVSLLIDLWRKHHAVRSSLT